MFLHVTELSARYGRIPVLNGIDLQVAAGEFVGVLGHNGMGKTTLLRTLMGFVPASPSTTSTSLASRRTRALGAGSATCRRVARSSRA